MKAAVLFALAFPSVAIADGECPSGALNVISASDTLKDLLQSLGESYKSECPDFELNIVDDTNEEVIHHLCEEDVEYDIGLMDRDFNTSEYEEKHGWYEYVCHHEEEHEDDHDDHDHDHDRVRFLAGDHDDHDDHDDHGHNGTEVKQLNIAVHGYALVVRSGSNLADCLEGKSKKGLSNDNVRWAYSTFKNGELKKNGWDQSSLPGNDKLGTTHKWKEIDLLCPDVEISLVGPAIGSDDSAVYDMLTDAYFTHEDEKIRGQQSDGYPEFKYYSDFTELQTLLSDDMNAAIALVDLSYALDSGNNLYIVPTGFGSAFQKVYPTASVEYYADHPNPFSTEMFVVVRNATNFEPFLEFIMDDGDSIIEEKGLLPLPQCSKEDRVSRFHFDLTIAGSESVYPIASRWAEGYEMAFGGHIDVTMGGSRVGVERLCGNTSESIVDVGMMARPFTRDETEEDHHIHTCKIGDVGKKVLQIEVAVDGLTVTVQQGGAAHQCIKDLGGLTTDQLRWIFSSFKYKELKKDGWSVGAIPSNDRKSAHRWSELIDPKDNPNANCPNEEIILGVPEESSGTFDYFKDIILTGEGETFRGLGGDLQTKNFTQLSLLMHGEGDPSGFAISFYSYSFYYYHHDHVYAVPIMNQRKKFVAPSETTVNDGTYEPLARKITLAVDECKLPSTTHFIEYGMSSEGVCSVSKTAYSPLNGEKREEMYERMKGYDPHHCLDEDTFSVPRRKKNDPEFEYHCDDLTPQLCLKTDRKSGYFLAPHCPVTCNYCDIKCEDDPYYSVRKKKKDGFKYTCADVYTGELDCYTKYEPRAKPKGARHSYKKVHAREYCRKACHWCDYHHHEGEHAHMHGEGGHDDHDDHDDHNETGCVALHEFYYDEGHDHDH